MKRAVYEAIGGLDERFGLGLFDDDDFAERARRAGFDLAVAHDLFVHHFGSRTFTGNAIDAKALLDENSRRFKEKWGVAALNGRRVALAPFTPDRPSNVASPPPQQSDRRHGRPETAPPCIPAPPGASERGRTASEPSLGTTLLGPNSVLAPGRAPARGAGNGPTTVRCASEGPTLTLRGSQGPMATRSPNQTGPRSRVGLVYAPPAALRDAEGTQSTHEAVPTRRMGTGRDRGSSLSAAAPATRVSLTMIVRNEERNLPHALKSVDGLFDETIIVDTGSTDRTVEIARSFGARVFDFPWVDDFAAARNAALEHATGHYVCWLDADDVVEPAERAKLQRLLGDLGTRDAAGYVFRCACDPSPDGAGGETVVDHIRLFPVRNNIRWTYRVHEQILPALRKAKIPVRWTDITVRHTGYVDKALRGSKLDRDTRILKAELDDRPDDPFVLFNLGAIAVERGNWAGAIGYLEGSLKGSAPTDSIVRKIYALIARASSGRRPRSGPPRLC